MFPNRSNELQLIMRLLFGFAPRRAPRDGAAENAFQSCDEVGGAERPAGPLCRSEHGKSGIVGLVGDQRREVRHAIEHRSDVSGEAKTCRIDVLRQSGNVRLHGARGTLPLSPYSEGHVDSF